MVEKLADASLEGLEDVIHSRNRDLWLKNGWRKVALQDVLDVFHEEHKQKEGKESTF